MHLEVEDVAAAYGDKLVLDGVSLSLERGQIVSLIGPSGSGKSSLLRMLVGLLPPRRGTIRFDGETLDYRDRAVIRRMRDRFAIVFQQYNLFQNMDVLRNVAIAPIKVKGWPREDCERDGAALLRKVGLGDHLHRYPDQLSGGQQQRVALARAMALKPEILLLDEVTAALDPELVYDVLESIRVLAREGMTMLIVSHEMAFVREISSRVVFMADGKVVETGTPREIFETPTAARTQDFIGKILRH